MKGKEQTVKNKISSQRYRPVVSRFLLSLLPLAALFVFSGHAARAGAGADSQTSPDTGLVVLESTSDSMLIELRAPAPTFETITENDQQFDLVALDDSYQWTEIAGRPQLPVRYTLLGIPNLATVQVEVLEVDEERLPGHFVVYPVPERVTSLAPEPGERIVDPAEPLAAGTEYRFAFDAAFYQQDVRYPAAIVEIGDKGFMRDQVVSRLKFHPLRTNPARGELWFASRIRVRLLFDAPRSTTLGLAAAAPASGSDPLAPRATSFDEALASTLLNYQQALAWRVPRQRAPVRALQPAAASSDENRYRVEVVDEGLYEISYETLSAAGAPVDQIDPQTLRMEFAGQEVAIELIGAEDGAFDPGDGLRFYGLSADSIYTWRNVYWLSFDGSPGLQVTTRSVPPGSSGETPQSFRSVAHFEDSAYYQSELPREGFEQDRWYWTFTRFRERGAILSRTVTITLEIPTTVPFTATLRPRLQGATSRFLQNPDHYARFFVNGQQVGEAYWDGYTAFQGDFTFDGSLLQPGINTFTLNTPGGLPDVSEDVVFLNWLEIEYQQAYRAVDDQLRFQASGAAGQIIRVDGFSTAAVGLYDVTDPGRMARLTDFAMANTGGAYRLSFSPAADGQTRSYLAVTSPRFQAPVALVQDTPSQLHDPSQAADYLVITHGDFLPAAQALAAHRARTGFSPLVIDVQDIYDEFSAGLLSPVAIRDFLAYAYQNWPDPAPAYVLLLGDGVYDFKDYLGYGASTYVPPLLDAVDPFIGETATDNNYVTIVGNDPLPDMHIGRLPANSPAEAWTMVNKTIDYETAPEAGDWRYNLLFITDNADTAGNFYYLSNEVADNLAPSPYQVNKIYYGQNYSDILATRNAVRSAITQGALLANYVGHSSITWWAAEILLAANDVASLGNGSRLPVMLPMTCYDGYFHSPIFSSLAETLVRANARGAVASWSATGQGVATGHDYLHRGFYEAVFYSGVRRLGPATLAGKLKLFSDDFRFQDLIETYGLLGDPALELNLPNADLMLNMGVTPPRPVQQGDILTYTITYANNDLATVPQAVLTAAIPSALVDIAVTSSDPGVVARPGTRFVWDLGALEIYQGGRITVTGRVPDALLPLDAPYTAGSRVLSVWKEDDLRNNKGGPLQVPVLPADLAVDLEAVSGAVGPGGPISVRLAYRNNGPARVAGAQVALPLPAWFQDPLFSFVGPQPTWHPGSNLIWDLPLLLAGEQGAIIVQGTLSSDASASMLPLQLQAAVAAGWPDNIAANNTTAPVAIDALLPDAYEPDNSPAQATPLPVPGASLEHTYSFEGDFDWLRFVAEAGVRYRLRIENLSAGGDTVLSLHDASGARLEKNDDFFPGSGWSGLDWTAPADGVYYLAVTRSPDSAAAYRYDLTLATVGFSTFLPALAVH